MFRDIVQRDGWLGWVAIIAAVLGGAVFLALHVIRLPLWCLDRLVAVLAIGVDAGTTWLTTPPDGKEAIRGRP